MNATTAAPPLDADACYRALLARDARFDGLFFVGVTTTGIYCRSVCSARTPGRARCQFFPSAAVAEREGFRACFRCRPELAPGANASPGSKLVAAAVARIEEGAVGDESLGELARDLGVSSRHLRRAMQAELGVSPVELVQSRRLALAKQLLHDTSLSMTAVALASGFSSIRRFNAAFRARFDRAPSALRRESTHATSEPSDSFPVTLAYRPPLDWPSLLRFLGARAIPGVETAHGSTYLRTAKLGRHRGWVAVTPVEGRPALRAQVSLSLAPALMPLVARLRHLFDLDAHPSTVAAHLADDAILGPLVTRRPGLRVPGAFDGFEVGVRAVLGQQVSVAAATTLAGRLAAKFGEPLTTPHETLTTVFPTAAKIARASDQELGSIGLTRARAATLGALARAVVSGDVHLDAGGDVDQVTADLESLPGIGPWTAAYIAMRALRAPDAFPGADLALRRALGDVSSKEAHAQAERWRPWRAYAALHLWTSLAAGDPK